MGTIDVGIRDGAGGARVTLRALGGRRGKGFIAGAGRAVAVITALCGVDRA
jgi:hypothetical protein